MASRPAPPPSQRAVELATLSLLRRSAAAAADPRLQLQAALAAVSAATNNNAPPLMQLRAHLAAADALHAHAEEEQTCMQHVRSALALCAANAADVPADLLLGVLSSSVRISQHLLQDGLLKEARSLLEVLQGVLQEEWPGLTSNAHHAAARRLSAHAALLRLHLLLSEGKSEARARLSPSRPRPHPTHTPAPSAPLQAAGRMLTTVHDEISALPPDPPPAGAPDARWAARGTLLLAHSLLEALLLARQGDLDEATDAVDALLGATRDCVADAACPAAERAAASGLGLEGSLLRATLHLARLELADALALVEQLRGPLCGGAGRPHGEAAFEMLLAHAALALAEPAAAAAALRRATGCSGLAAGPRLWSRLVGELLAPTPPAARCKALQALAAAGELRPMQMLRAAVSLGLGVCKLELGRPEEAARFLGRCVQHAAGEARCDALTALAMTATAQALTKAAPGTEEDESESGGEAAAGPAEPLGKKRRIERREDSLHSALVLATRMRDRHAQARALAGLAAHHEAAGDAEQTTQFRGLLRENGAALQEAARGGARARLLALAAEDGEGRRRA